jgi:hypothetical protein
MLFDATHEFAVDATRPAFEKLAIPRALYVENEISSGMPALRAPTPRRGLC